MLCNLVVENYALISQLEIEFRQGLTIITGETGAGKSILLGALSLILGKRADTSVLFDKNKKCFVEGTFDITRYGIESFFQDHEIDYDHHTLVRREISPAGKSRAFLNDIPVNLDLLTEFGRKLIDIHSQHQNLNLADSMFQLRVIDSYAQNQDLISEYNRHFASFRTLEKKHVLLTEEAIRLKSDLDYFQFQFDQLGEARLVENEQEELELELGKLTHAEEVKSALSGATLLLQGENDPALSQVRETLTLLNRIHRYLPGGENLLKRIESAYIELKDVAQEIELLNHQFYLDPERLAIVNERLNLLHTLQKKHNVTSVAALILIRDNLQNKINEIASIDFSLEGIAKELDRKRIQLASLADELTKKRQEVIAPVELKITELLREVGIPNALFRVLLFPTDDFGEKGQDRIQFLFSANKNTEPQDIARVASGGELSRLMLCIKSLISDSTGLPTLVFDEIDTGVSGETAERVGNIIQRMAEKMQIINITHLPQVASKGDQHYLVYKSEEAHTAETRVKLLTPEERHIEIAKMLSGEEVTKAALENARALLGN
jgi:DNA repair protein RecN (Recombination protein N)